MSKRELKSLYHSVATAYPDVYRTLKKIVESIYTLSALTRLIEVRIEEIERRMGRPGTPASSNEVPEMIDDREISIIVGNKRGESR